MPLSLPPSPGWAYALVCAESDSMAPTIDRGDLLLVDCRTPAVDRAGVYVIALPGLVRPKDASLAVRRADLVPGGVSLLCDNPLYGVAGETVVAHDALRVVGRVVYVLGRL